MAGFASVRESIQNFLRKYDEVVTPIGRFIAAYILFSCINSLFGYSEFLNRGIITFLLAVISALVTTPVVVFMAGVVVAIHCFSVSVDVGVLTLLLFLVIYCSYVRMFPNTGFVLALVPILYMLKIPYAAPVLIAIFAGFSGAIPAAFGVVIYYFAQYVKEADATIRLGEDTDFQGYAYVVNGLMKDKNMLLAVIGFAVIALITAFVYRLRFDYAWYVAIAIGSVCTVLVFLICGMAVSADVPAGSLVIGAVLGCILSFLVQMCKSVVDYSRKETVQFEDDDYYYYVKAIPKFGNDKKRVKNMTAEQRPQAQANRSAQTGQRPQTNRSAQTGQRPQANRSAQTGQRPQANRSAQTGQRPQANRSAQTGQRPQNRQG